MVKNEVVIQPHKHPWTRVFFVDFWGIKLLFHQFEVIHIFKVGSNFYSLHRYKY